MQVSANNVGIYQLKETYGINCIVQAVDVHLSVHSYIHPSYRHNRCSTEMVKHTIMQTGCEAALPSAISEMILEFWKSKTRKIFDN